MYVCPALRQVCRQAHAIIRHHEINMQEKKKLPMNSIIPFIIIRNYYYFLIQICVEKCV